MYCVKAMSKKMGSAFGSDLELVKSLMLIEKYHIFYNLKTDFIFRYMSKDSETMV